MAKPMTKTKKKKKM
jgi:hypothetical protein